MARKRRPRKALRDTHISGYSLPVIDDAAWETLQKAVGVPLDKNARIKIQDIVNLYTEESLSLIDGADRLKLSGRKDIKGKAHEVTDLTRFRRSWQAFISEWEAANKNEILQRMLLDFDVEQAYKSKTGVSLTGLMAGLTRMRFSFSLYLERVNSRTVPVSASSDPFVKLVKNLAPVVKKAGGKISKTGMTENSKKPPAFVNFILHINRILPQNVRRPVQSHSALAKSISRALAH